jgi:hypothetical protein
VPITGNGRIRGAVGPHQDPGGCILIVLHEPDQDPELHLPGPRSDIPGDLPPRPGMETNSVTIPSEAAALILGHSTAVAASESRHRRAIATTPGRRNAYRHTGIRIGTAAGTAAHPAGPAVRTNDNKAGPHRSRGVTETAPRGAADKTADTGECAVATQPAG